MLQLEPSLFALDEDTITRIQRLADPWNVSQAEDVRRVVERVAVSEEAGARELLYRLHELQRRTEVDATGANAYLSRVVADRTAWRGADDSP